MAGSSEKEFSFVTHKGTRQVCGSAFKSAVKSHPVVIHIGVQKLQKKRKLNSSVVNCENFCFMVME